MKPANKKSAVVAVTQALRLLQVSVAEHASMRAEKSRQNTVSNHLHGRSRAELARDVLGNDEVDIGWADVRMKFFNDAVDSVCHQVHEQPIGRGRCTSVDVRVGNERITPRISGIRKGKEIRRT